MFWYYFQELARIVELPFSIESLICVRPPKMEFAVVGMERSGFTCTFCHTGTQSCPHVKCIKSLIENEPEMVPDFVLYILNRHEALRTSFPRTYTRSAVSTEAIPVNVLPSQVNIFNGLLRSTINNAEDDDLKLYYDVYSRSCPSCQSEFEERTIFSERRKKLYTLKNIFEFLVSLFGFRMLCFVLGVNWKLWTLFTKPSENPLQQPSYLQLIQCCFLLILVARHAFNFDFWWHSVYFPDHMCKLSSCESDKFTNANYLCWWCLDCPQTN